LKNDNEMSDFKDVNHGAWTGFQCFGTNGWTTRVGRFFDVPSKLVELVFLWKDRAVVEDLRRTLETFTFYPARDGLQRWRAFGMNLLVDADYVLSDCKVQPAMAVMTFVDRDDRPKKRTVFERHGLVDEWLDCGVDKWLSARRPKKVSQRMIKRFGHAHHDISRETGKMPALHFPQFDKHKNVYDGTAWICPADNRLYHVSSISPANDDSNDKGRSISLSCCDAFKLDDKI